MRVLGSMLGAGHSQSEPFPHISPACTTTPQLLPSAQASLPLTFTLTLLIPSSGYVEFTEFVDWWVKKVRLPAAAEGDGAQEQPVQQQ